MNKYPCQTCKANLNGCNRTVGKQGDKYICGDYNPVVECSTCKHDNLQLVEPNCIGCGLHGEYKNWTLKI